MHRRAVLSFTHGLDLLIDILNDLVAGRDRWLLLALRKYSRYFDSIKRVFLQKNCSIQSR